MQPTKANAERLLNRLYAGSRVIVNDNGQTFGVELEAPSGTHWGDGIHCRVCSEWFVGGWTRAEYWEMVIEEIGELDPPEACGPECEYWDGEPE